MSADGWQAAQNWLLFGAIAGGLAFYYYPKGHKAAAALPVPVRAPSPQAKSRTPVGKDRSPKPKKSKNDSTKEKQVAPPAAPSPSQGKASKSSPKSLQSLPQRPQTSRQPLPDDDQGGEKDEQDLKQWVKSMNAARQGTQLKSSDAQKSTVRTVKQSNAPSSVPLPVPKQPVEAEDDSDDWSHVGSSSVAVAGEVADMLEPVASGPSSLRITAPQETGKAKKAPRQQPKKEEVESKKQRQNRLKKEAQRVEREAAEKERKALEERQRRTARESRGEPARNGVISHAAAPPPASSAWTPSTYSAAPAVQEPTSHTHDSQLLDTFDADSTSSSYVGGSTAATSTSDIAAAGEDIHSSAVAAAAEAELQSGWNEVRTKKGKKKPSHSDLNAAAAAAAAASAIAQPKAVAPNPSTVFVNGTKPNGFQALEDVFDQHHNGSAPLDPSDAAAWEA